MPDSLRAPESQPGVRDITVISQALQATCADVVRQIKAGAMLPSDLASYAPIADGDGKHEHVSVEEVGAVKLDAKPVGPGESAALEAALNDAYGRLMSSIGVACPGANITDAEVRGKATVVSKGWNPAAREYRVRVKFEGDVRVAALTTEVRR